MPFLRPFPATVVAALLLLSRLMSASQAPQRTEASRMSMGCLYSIAAYGEPASVAPALERALDEVDRIDRLMSHYKADSSVSRLNRDAARAPVQVEPELFDFIALALEYAEASDGAFDVTVGPLMRAWGFFQGEGRLPTGAELSRARRAVGYRHVLLNRPDRTIRFVREGVELDLGGIAKGYAVDRAVAILNRDGVSSALVNACGSTLYALGKPPDRPEWTVAVQDPLDERISAFEVPLKDHALSISGVSEKSFVRDGIRYSHIMDPRTGRPVRGVLAVVVLAPTGTAGDAIDNVLFVQGAERGRAFLRRHPGVSASVLLPAAGGGWTRVEVR